MILAAVEGAEQAGPAIPPYVVGGLALAILLLLMLGLLMFGKGREHT